MAFIWGSGGQRMTPEQIARQRAYAQQQMQAGADYSPVGHWSQGLSRVAQSLLGAMAERRAMDAEDANAAESRRVAEALLATQEPAAVPAALPGTDGAAGAAPVVDTLVGVPASSGAAPGAAPGMQGASPVLQALVSPYLDEGTRQLAMTMYQQQQRQGDPLYQAQIAKARAEAAAASDPMAQLPDAVRALDYRARAAGYQPGSPEYRAFMETGGSPAKAPETQTFYDAQGREYRAQWNPQSRQWERVGGSKLPSGMILRTNPDGSVELIQGAAVNKPLTEGQAKDTVYATRAEGALPTLNTYDTQLANPVQQFVEKDPTGLVRGRVQTEEFQLAKQAADEFIQALLRKDTGATITPQEQSIYGTTYLPQPGDSPAVIEQKRASRARALAAIKAGLPPEAIVQQERALRSSGSPAMATERRSSPRQEFVTRNRPISDMTDEELEAIANGNR